jgi:hypothetical protein
MLAFAAAPGVLHGDVRLPGEGPGVRGSFEYLERNVAHAVGGFAQLPYQLLDP